MGGDFDIKKYKVALGICKRLFRTSFIMRNVASKCMYIMLFVKCKKSFQSFQHAKISFLEYVTGFWYAKAVHAVRLNFILLIIFFIYFRLDFFA